jgi:hypothetical protein
MPDLSARGIDLEIWFWGMLPLTKTPPRNLYCVVHLSVIPGLDINLSPNSLRRRLKPHCGLSLVEISPSGAMTPRSIIPAGES